MMAEYYYLVSSLPFLRFSERPPLTYSQFLEQCEIWPGKEAFAQLQCARVDIENIPVEGIRNESLKQWILFENSLRNQLVKLRAQRLGVQPEAHMRRDLPWDPSVVARLSEVLKERSPFEAELALLEMRWQFLTHQEAGHYFDLDALVIYALKLQLLERSMRFDPEAGKRVLQKIIEENLSDGGEHRHDRRH